MKTFHSPFSRLLNSSFIDDVIYFSYDYIVNVIKMLTESGSGIRIERIEEMEINIGIYKPIRPRGYIEIPKGLQRRHGLLNIKTNVNCFKLCILAALFEDKLQLSLALPPEKAKYAYHNSNLFFKLKLEKPQTYDQIVLEVDRNKLLDFSGFESSIDINDIHLFERKNRISVNIYEYDDALKDVYPTRITTFSFGIERHINLLLLSNGSAEHLVLIRNPSRFFGRHDMDAKTVCPWCSQGFTDPDHLTKCKTMNDIGLSLPSPKQCVVKFRDFHKFLPPVYKMYADFLYITENTGVSVAGYAILVLGPHKNIYDFKYYIGKDAMTKFLPYALSVASRLKTLIKDTNLPIPEMTHEEITLFDDETECEICGSEFTVENPKTRHHSHHIHGYRVTPACQKCNLQIKPKYQIPLFSPTQTKLGAPMIIQHLKENEATSIRIIPKSNESFISVIFGNKLKLVDTRKFLDFSLPELVKKLVASEKLEYLDNFNNELSMDYLTTPWYFPHTWFDSFEKLKCITFPPIEMFHDILEEKDTGLNEYEHSLQLYNKLNCKTFKDYCVVYLKSRVLQTAATMEQFGESCMKNYSLSPLYDLSLASYAYATALYHSQAEIEIPTDPAIIKTVLENIRGGVSHLSKRIVTARSERLGHTNVNDAERVEILIADLNSLYQSCLAQPLPINGYRKWSKEEISSVIVEKLPWNTGKGWIVTVSLHYPDSIKEHTKDYPLCPTKHNIRTDYLQGEAHISHQKCAPSQRHQLGVNNLLLTQFDKENVAIYYKLLQFYLRHGLQVKQVHDIIEFNEEAYLKNFIDKNIDIRKNATNKFEEQISKSIGNMIFGKFLSINNNLNVKCADTKSKAIKYLSKHDFEDFKIISDDVSLFYSKKGAVKLDKNVLVSSVVLDLAKLRLYEMIYDVLKPKFRDRITIVASETDNLVAEIRDPHKTFIQDLFDIKEYFDFSTLPVNHPLYDRSRAKEPSLLKIEYPYPLQFVGIKSKLYSILNQCDKCRLSNTDIGLSCENCKNVPKGGPKRRHTDHGVYLRTALGQKDTSATEFMSFSCINQQVNVTSKKRSIFNIEDKHRVWLNNNESVPYGYFPVKVLQSKTWTL